MPEQLTTVEEVAMAEQVVMFEQVAELFRVEAGLLAFILAFYALCSRERRAPYITHTVYSEIGLVLLAVFLTLLTLMSIGGPAWLSWTFRGLAQLLLLIAILATLKRVYSIANHDVRLRDDKWWLVLPLRWQCYLWQRRRKHDAEPGRSYEHQSVSPSNELMDDIVKAGWPPINKTDGPSTGGRIDGAPGRSATLSLIAPSYQISDAYSLKLATAFLKRGHYVQYTPSGRHPMEFVLKLQSHLNSTWQQTASRVVVVDAYSPHFGFHDSVHETRTKFLNKQLGVSTIPCPPTFAGIHTATANAFNLIRAKEKSGPDTARKPALLIFEATYALVDLESPEQYRRFVRHVIPSERMWGSMFTAFIELGLDDDSKRLLRSYSDYFSNESADIDRQGGVNT